MPAAPGALRRGAAVAAAAAPAPPPSYRVAALVAAVVAAPWSRTMARASSSPVPWETYVVSSE